MQLGRRFRKLPRADQALLIKTMTMSCAGLLDEWFESPELKATLAATGTIGTYGSPRTPGTAFVFLHYYLGEANGAPGAWGFVRGAMGGIAQAVADAARTRPTSRRPLTISGPDDRRAGPISIWSSPPRSTTPWRRQATT